MNKLTNGIQNKNEGWIKISNEERKETNLVIQIKCLSKILIQSLFKNCW